MRVNTRRWGVALALIALPALAGGCQDTKGDKGKTKAKAKAKLSGPQRIACDKPVHNYGKVSRGKKVEHIFAIKNVGGAPLTIQRASGG